MAIAVASQSNTAGYSNASSVVITKSTGLAVGDLMVALIHINGDGTVTTPSNWTQGTAQAQGTTQSLTYLYKIADSSDAAATNFTFNLSGTLQSGGGMLRITGTAFSSLVQAVDQDTSSSSSTTFPGGVTQANAGSLLILALGMSNGQQNGDFSTPAVANDNPTWSEGWEFERNLTDGNNFVHHLSYAVRATASATGDYSINDGGYVNVNCRFVTFLVCINPAISVTVTPSAITGSSVVNTPAVAGGATVTPNAVAASSAINTPSHMGQADWSSQQKSSAPTWSPQDKS